jgi:uncharacterized protein (TIGR00156 family)
VRNRFAIFVEPSMLHRKTFLLGLGSLIALRAQAQFTGPGVAAPTTSVAQLRQARVGSYATVEGRIVAHQRQNYYSFRDASGEIRVEIEPALWQNRKIGPDDKVRLIGEVDQGPAGRYLWVKSLDLVS